MSYRWTCLNCFHHKCFNKKEVLIMKEEWLFPPKVDVPLTGRDTCEPRNDKKELCKLNQLIPILLIKGGLCIFAAVMPFHCAGLSFSVLLGMCCLLHQHAVFELTVAAIQGSAYNIWCGPVLFWAFVIPCWFYYLWSF